MATLFLPFAPLPGWQTVMITNRRTYGDRVNGEPVNSISPGTHVVPTMNNPDFQTI